jgi:peptidoglycan/LPS O-acetylase OafA/YrhL
MRPLFVDPAYVGGVLWEGYLGHMWSLAVEEQFYLVWPLAMIGLALPTRRAGNVVKALLGIALAIAVIRLFVYYLPPLDPDLASIAIFSFDAFALGAAMSFAFHRGAFPALERFLARPAVAVAGVAVLIADLLAGKWAHEVSSLYVVYTSLAAAMIIGHVFVAPESRASRVAALPAVVYIGKLSYSIYLWHNPIWVFVSSRRYPDVPLVMLTLAEWALTAVAVLGSYYLVEKPAMRLRKRFAH